MTWESAAIILVGMDTGVVDLASVWARVPSGRVDSSQFTVASGGPGGVIIPVDYTLTRTLVSYSIDWFNGTPGIGSMVSMGLIKWSGNSETAPTVSFGSTPEFPDPFEGAHDWIWRHVWFPEASAALDYSVGDADIDRESRAQRKLAGGEGILAVFSVKNLIDPLPAPGTGGGANFSIDVRMLLKEN